MSGCDDLRYFLAITRAGSAIAAAECFEIDFVVNEIGAPRAIPVGQK